MSPRIPGRGLRDDLRLLRHARDWRGRARTPRSAQRWEHDAEPEGFPTGWARSATAGVLRAALQRGVMKPVVWSQTRPIVEGLEYLESVRGPAMFVSNHSSHLDTPAILGSLPTRITDRLAVGAAADYFFDSRARAAVTTLLFNAFPVERRSRKRDSLASELVDEGWSLLLFPEGSRSADGWMGMFKLGAAQLCLMKKIPAVPIALRGTFAAMPRGRRWPSAGRPSLTVRYGRPLHVRNGEGVGEFRSRMVEAVARLWAEDDLGWYGALRAATEGDLQLPVSRRGALPSTPRGELLDPAAASWRRMWEATRPRVEDGPRQVWTD